MILHRTCMFSPRLQLPKVVDTLLGIRLQGRVWGRDPIVSGSRNSIAIDAQGQMLSWGWNARGTLGHGHAGEVSKPRRGHQTL